MESVRCVGFDDKLSRDNREARDKCHSHNSSGMPADRLGATSQR